MRMLLVAALSLAFMSTGALADAEIYNAPCGDGECKVKGYGQGGTGGHVELPNGDGTYDTYSGGRGEGGQGYHNPVCSGGEGVGGGGEHCV
jgi:hypothetical protein